MIKESTLKRIFVVREGVRYGIFLSRCGFAGKELHLNSSWTLLVLTSLVDEALLIQSKANKDITKAKMMQITKEIKKTNTGGANR